jgi:hypothetical protein
VESGGSVLEYWYSSGGYTRVPASLQEQLAAGQPVVIEAGAIIPGSAGGTGASNPTDSESSRPAAVTRWLLTYSATNGLQLHGWSSTSFRLALRSCDCCWLSLCISS